MRARAIGNLCAMLMMSFGAVAMAYAQGNAPTVSVAITAPANNSIVSAPGNITLNAAASVNRANWEIVRVEFYEGSRLLGVATSVPYAFNWTNVPAGRYSVTAKAIATNPGQAKQAAAAHPNMPTWSATSAPVSIKVNAPPVVAVSAPSGGTVGTAPTNVTVSATATDTDGTIAKVDFYANGTLIGTRTQAPYSITWNGVAAGSYVLTATATDNDGASASSSPIAVRVNAAPTIALTGPANNAVFASRATITVTANAGDSDGGIAKVDFYANNTLIATASSAPYTASWPAVVSGRYSLTAVATDSDEATTTSAAILIRINALPQVDITAPGPNTVLNAPANINIVANASDEDGTIQRVEFFANGALIGGANQAPYATTWASVPAGTYSLTAVAADNDSGASTSTVIPLRVNGFPSVNLTSPTNHASFKAPATITLTATAQDLDGSVAGVEFYAGTNLLATLTTAPYAYQWTNVRQGNYSITARAVDDNGAGTVSAPITITVASAEMQVYYIHTDHLNTPRLITNEAGQAVWSWANDDPFANNPPNEDPGNTGTSFTCNLRFPGQYFDKETNLHYNYFRDYEATVARYIESDPKGLDGGLNIYGYVGSNPLRYVDSQGLEAEFCQRMFYPAPVPLARHCFIRFDREDNRTLSFDDRGVHRDPAPSWWFGKTCTPTKGQQDDECVEREMNKCKAEDYDFSGKNCCHCVEVALRACGMTISKWPNWPINPGPPGGPPPPTLPRQ